MIRPKLLYLIGSPGTGKTTLVRRIERGVPVEELHVPHVWWRHYSDEACQLGRDRGIFAGTDTLHLTAQKGVLDWLSEIPYRYVLAEGDRLGNESFFNAVRDIGYVLTVVALVVPPATLEARREARWAEIQALVAEGNLADVGNPMRQGKPIDLAKKRDESWLKGRETKNDRLMTWVLPENVLDGTLPPLENFRALKPHPVVKAIRRARTNA